MEVRISMGRLANEGIDITPTILKWKIKKKSWARWRAKDVTGLKITNVSFSFVSNH